MSKLVILYSFLAFGLSCNGVLAEMSSSDLNSLIGTYSKTCQATFYNSIDANSFNTKLYCSSSSLTVYNYYIIVLGFCEQNELSNFTDTVCSTTTLNQPDSETKMTFLAAMENVSLDCQKRVLTCIRSSAVSIVLKTQKHFCPLMELKLQSTNIEKCLSSGNANCKTEEFQQLRDGACVSNETNVDQKFSNAILDTSLDCQSRLDQCARLPDTFNYILKKQYCELMNYQNMEVNLKAFLTGENHCNVSEFSTLVESACGEQTSVVTSYTTTVTPTMSSENNTTVTIVTSTDAQLSTPPVKVQGGVSPDVLAGDSNTIKTEFSPDDSAAGAMDTSLDNQNATPLVIIAPPATTSTTSTTTTTTIPPTTTSSTTTSTPAPATSTTSTTTTTTSTTTTTTSTTPPPPPPPATTTTTTTPKPTTTTTTTTTTPVTQRLTPPVTAAPPPTPPAQEPAITPGYNIYNPYPNGGFLFANVHDPSHNGNLYGRGRLNIPWWMLLFEEI